MVFDKFLESRRKGELEKINAELSSLKKQGLQYETSGKPGAAVTISGPTPKPYSKLIIGGLIVLLVLTWFITHSYYKGKLNTIMTEKETLDASLALSEIALENATATVTRLEKERTDLEEGKGEINTLYEDLVEENEDLVEENDELIEEISDLSLGIVDLNKNISHQEDLTDFYMDCITDEINEDLDICGNPPN